MQKKRILFLCTGNSARSQMAEALMKTKAGNRWEVFSAGTNPVGINPLTIQVLNEIGIDTTGHYSKDLREFENQQFDTVITVCDRAKQSCPVFPAPDVLHWSIPDPQGLDGFRAVRDDLSRRIDSFLHQAS